jgi:hypothetical protein
MEKTQWLTRQREAQAMAKDADHSVARLIHYDMAGRYGIKAHNVPAPAQAPMPVPALG